MATTAVNSESEQGDQLHETAVRYRPVKRLSKVRISKKNLFLLFLNRCLSNFVSKVLDIVTDLNPIFVC